eukprot:5019825-Pyramimonas_sp.AAC.1
MGSDHTDVLMRSSILKQRPGTNKKAQSKKTSTKCRVTTNPWPPADTKRYTQKVADALAVAEDQ